MKEHSVYIGLGSNLGDRVAYLRDAVHRLGAIIRIERDGVPVPNGFAITADETISGLRVVIGYGTGVLRGLVTFKGDPPKSLRIFAIASGTGGTSAERWAPVDDRGQFAVKILGRGEAEPVVLGHSFAALPRDAR